MSALTPAPGVAPCFSCAFTGLRRTWQFGANHNAYTDFGTAATVTRIRSTGAPPLMKGGDKKRRRSTAPAPSSPPSTAQQPARINIENTTLSVRKQLSLVRRHAERLQAEEGSGRPVVRTSFRRRKAGDGEGGGRRVGRQARDTAVPDGKYDVDDDALPPVMFIDGYNVIGKWARLRKWRDRDDLEQARRLLVDDVEQFSSIRGWKCTVVFDAMGRSADRLFGNGNGNESNANGNTSESSDAGHVNIVFTGNETADSFIERSVFEHCRSADMKRQVWAITSDVAQAKVSGAIGAHVMSASLFVQELKRSKKETRDAISQSDGSAYRARMLMSNVDAETLKQLYRLRDGYDLE